MERDPGALVNTDIPVPPVAEPKVEFGVPVYREFLNKLRRDKNLSYRDLAVKMGTPDHLLEARVKQLQHFFNDSANPNAALAKAIERALSDGDKAHPLNLPPEDYGWNPEAL